LYVRGKREHAEEAAAPKRRPAIWRLLLRKVIGAGMPRALRRGGTSIFRFIAAYLDY